MHPVKVHWLQWLAWIGDIGLQATPSANQHCRPDTSLPAEALIDLVKCPERI